MRKRIRAWYYRNIKYKNITFPIDFDNYKPSLFEILCTDRGERMIYIGNKKFISIKRTAKL